MSYPLEVREWIARRAQKDEELYQRHGTALELEHTGKFAAISDDGRIFLGNHELDVAMQAVKEFGSGNFALRRIGYKENIRWRRPVL